MSYFIKEPPYQHGDAPKIGIILANLGTPDSLSTQAVRKYLQQFLMDRRVVEVPRFIWCWILHFIILVFRPGSSAKKYSKVWTKKGSPLLVNARNQTNALSAKIKKTVSQPVEVELGMSYGNPSMKNAVLKLKEKNCTKILLLPLYPQYAASSSASAMDALWRVLLKTRNVPAVRTVRNYHDHPLYINALKLSILKFWKKNGRPSKLVMSFHGIPKKSLMQGDPYHCECYKTARLLAEALKLKESEYMVCFQSRFGRAEWLKPYYAEVMADLGKKKEKNVHVICPGFSSDCLETLEEINIEGRHIFLHHGGKSFSYIPALNDNPEWINAMQGIILENLQGWIDKSWTPKKEALNSALTKKRALLVEKKQS